MTVKAKRAGSRLRIPAWGVGAVFLLALESPALSSGEPSAAASKSGGFVIHEIRVHGASYHYAVYVPPRYDRLHSWPCIVFLHGSGECGTDGEKPAQVGLGPAILAHPERWPFVVVMPQKPKEEDEWEAREDLVLAALRAARKTYRIDPHRVALGGMSQGGHGTWTIAAKHPRTWSCLVPVCGYGEAATLAPRVASIPVWAFHGLKDDVVDPHETQQMVEAIRRERTRRGLEPEGRDGARMTLYPDRNHGCWDAAFAEEELPGWILEHRRNR